MPTVELIESPWNVDGQVFAGVTLRGVSAGKGGFTGLNFADHVGDNAERVAQHRTLIASQILHDLNSAKAPSPVPNEVRRVVVQRDKAAYESELSWHWLNQVHGTSVHEINGLTQISAGECPEADAVVTRIPRQVCCILTADCLPVFFYNPTTSQVALAHAGWRGLAEGVLESTVRAMGGEASAIQVWFGPAIGPCHFEVGAEVRNQFSAASESTESLRAVQAAFTPSKNAGRFMADIYALAVIKLETLGIRAISGAGQCTFCEPERFYSFRREAESGRLLSLIFIK